MAPDVKRPNSCPAIAADGSLLIGDGPGILRAIR